MKVDMDEANKEFVRIIKSYGLNPILFREIVLLRNRGKNNGEISQQTGTNRNTVNKYVNALRTMDEPDLATVMILVALTGSKDGTVKRLLKELWVNDPTST